MRRFFFLMSALLGTILLAITMMVTFVRRQPAQTSYLTAFSSSDSSSTHVFLARSDGSHVRRLTGLSENERSPVWSNDGRRILFTTWIDNTPHSCHVRPNGTALTCIRFSAVQTNLSWSPDGEWVSFVSPKGGNMSIYRMRPDGSDLARLTGPDDNDHSPEWSPDGEWIVFSSTEQGDAQIYRMRADGSQRQRLTNLAGTNTFPAWSPDGEWIAFIAYRSSDTTIYRMRSDGTELQPVLVDPSEQMEVIWSPDGRWLIFVSTRQGEGYDLYQISPDGENLRRLTQSSRTNFGMQWSPDGAWVFFISVGRNDNNIYRIRPAGSSLKPVPLTRNHSDNTLFSISPIIDLPWRMWMPGGIAILLVAPAFIFGKLMNDAHKI